MIIDTAEIRNTTPTIGPTSSQRSAPVGSVGFSVAFHGLPAGIGVAESSLLPTSGIIWTYTIATTKADSKAIIAMRPPVDA